MYVNIYWYFPLDVSLLLLSRSVMSDSLQAYELQHARLPCPSSSPGACSNSCPLSWWCRTTISSSVVPFSSCLQSFPASESFLMNLALIRVCSLWRQYKKKNSVQFSCSVVSDSFWPHELQHARLPCSSPTPRVNPNPYPLSRWCHPIISSPFIPSPSSFNLSQHQGLFHWVGSLHQVAKVLGLKLNQSLQWIFRIDFL